MSLFEVAIATKRNSRKIQARTKSATIIAVVVALASGIPRLVMDKPTSLTISGVAVENYSATSRSIVLPTASSRRAIPVTMMGDNRLSADQTFR